MKLIDYIPKIENLKLKPFSDMKPSRDIEGNGVLLWWLDVRNLKSDEGNGVESKELFFNTYPVLEQEFDHNGLEDDDIENLFLEECLKCEQIDIQDLHPSKIYVAQKMVYDKTKLHFGNVIIHHSDIDMSEDRYLYKLGSSVLISTNQIPKDIFIILPEVLNHYKLPHQILVLEDGRKTIKASPEFHKHCVVLKINN